MDTILLTFCASPFFHTNEYGGIGGVGETEEEGSGKFVFPTPSPSIYLVLQYTILYGISFHPQGTFR